jgi:hypothetical protein
LERTLSTLTEVLMERQSKEQIEGAECQLMDAMLCPDISALDKLLAPELVFTNHLGHLMDKDDALIERPVLDFRVPVE